MITKIIKLKNVGLFANACPNGALDFQPVTSIYAENGRGKSTLAAVLRACADSDPARAAARSTIDKSEDPEIEILFDGNCNNKFAVSGWTGPAPSVLLFDAEFVETNIYSGFSVRSEQRQELLEFVLGEKAVQAKRNADELTEKIALQSRIIGESTKVLAAAAPSISPDEFVKLEVIEENTAATEIAILQERIRIATNAELINKRPTPELLKPLEGRLEPVFEVLLRRLPDIEAEAETAVKTHFAKHEHGETFEDWISQGQSYLITDECPFCGQTLDANYLVECYRSYFNEAYQSLKDQVADLADEIDALIPSSFADNVISNIHLNEARIIAWNEEIGSEIPAFDDDGLKTLVNYVRRDLLDLAQRKGLNPIEASCSEDEQSSVNARVEQANDAISTYNNDLKSILSSIADFVTAITGDEIEWLEDQVRILRARVQLGTSLVTDARDAYVAADVEKRRLEELKDAARKEGDELIKTTLVRYENHINQILHELGAAFSISSLSQDYRGGRGAPRAGYGIKIRDQQVSLNNTPDFSISHQFCTTLSEADKRTLALAVFIARLETEDDLASKVVILDDPVSSMDQNRRHQTVRRIVRIALECEQFILLSHDPHFLRTFNEQVKQSYSISAKVMQIARVQNGYSAFTDCDLNKICESEYYRNFRMLEEFVDGTSSAEIRDVAKAIRPLLEGFLHRRFPVHIPRGEMLGRIIHNHIETASSGPLINMQHCLHELDAVNDYAKQFQHDENPDSENVPVTDAQLLMFAQKTLDIIYGAI